MGIRRGAGAARRALWLSLWAGLFYTLTGGCNGVLGNEEGFLAAADAQATDSLASPEVLVEVDASSPPADAAGDANPCAFGEKACLGACVKLTDPNFGCGTAACDACGSAHATKAECAGVAGVLACKLTCADGWADCDGNGANGCEADLSKPQHCGTCQQQCSGLTPLCATQSATAFACSGSCPTGTVQCGTQCVNVATNAAHCGKCDNACPGVTGGTARCAASACNFECNALYHRCGDSCALRNDVTKCGASCRNCTATAPAGASAQSCTNEACVFACNGSLADCNGDLLSAATNGCETNLDGNPSNCGKCGRTCSTFTPSDGGANADGAVMTLDASSLFDGSTGTGQYCCHMACAPAGTTCN